MNNVLTGTLTVPGATFDVIAPVISGEHAKTVTVPKTARFAHVVYTVTAHDDTDATVRAVCKPLSGGPFNIGHTTVHCSATDSSANTATATSSPPSRVVKPPRAGVYVEAQRNRGAHAVPPLSALPAGRGRSR